MQINRIDTTQINLFLASGYIHGYCSWLEDCVYCFIVVLEASHFSQLFIFWDDLSDIIIRCSSLKVRGLFTLNNTPPPKKYQLEKCHLGP